MVATSQRAAGSPNRQALLMSKFFQSLITIAVVGTILGSAAATSEANSFPARDGSSSFRADADCWRPSGATVTNTCATSKSWHIPLLNTEGPLSPTVNKTVSVVAFGATTANNVGCFSTSEDYTGTILIISGSSNLSQFGVPLSILIPAVFFRDGSVAIDCDVGPGAFLITAAW
jgi:hypothetical protein